MGHILEDLEGTGKVSVNGEDLAAVSYHIQIAEDSAGGKDILGRIDILGVWTLLYNLVSTDTPLTLHLDDKRQVDFVITAEGEAMGSAFIQGVTEVRKGGKRYTR